VVIDQDRPLTDASALAGISGSPAELTPGTRIEPVGSGRGRAHIELADRSEIFDLRRSVLRPHLRRWHRDPEEAIRTRSTWPRAIRKVAAIGCATFFPQPLDGAGWRFRGMATVAIFAVGMGAAVGGAVSPRWPGAVVVGLVQRLTIAAGAERNGFTGGVRSSTCRRLGRTTFSSATSLPVSPRPRRRERRLRHCARPHQR
jgi:hypothetical protein